MGWDRTLEEPRIYIRKTEENGGGGLELEGESYLHLGLVLEGFWGEGSLWVTIL